MGSPMPEPPAGDITALLQKMASIIEDAIAQAADPRYIRVNGKPLFLVYRPLLLPDPAGFAARRRDLQEQKKGKQ